jgi:hypothetical protein
MHRALHSLIEACSCGTGRLACPILEALDDTTERIPDKGSTAKGERHDPH